MKTAFEPMLSTKWLSIWQNLQERFGPKRRGLAWKELLARLDAEAPEERAAVDEQFERWRKGPPKLDSKTEEILARSGEATAARLRRGGR